MNGNGIKTFIVDTANKYDRSIVAILVTLASIFAAYQAIGKKINELVSSTPVVMGLKVEQDKLKESMTDIKQTMKEIYREVRQINRR